MSERETDSLGEDGMSEEDQNRRRLERAGWTNEDLSLSLLLLLKKGLFFRWDAFPTGPLWVSLSSVQFEPDGGLSEFSVCGLRAWEAGGEAESEDSSCQGGLSEDFNRSLELSFFGLISLTRALAPIQWFFFFGAGS